MQPCLLDDKCPHRTAVCSSLQPQVPNCDLHHYIHECLAHLCGPGRLISAAEIALKGRILHSMLPSRKWPHVRNAITNAVKKGSINRHNKKGLYEVCFSTFLHRGKPKIKMKHCKSGGRCWTALTEVSRSNTARRADGSSPDYRGVMAEGVLPPPPLSATKVTWHNKSWHQHRVRKSILNKHMDYFESVCVN